MRLFTTIKTGYTAGVYGCTGEYFTLIMINGKNTSSIKFNGMYGSDERVREYLKNKGYTDFYTHGEYNRLNTREIHKPTNYSEYQLINGGKLDEQIKALRGKK